MQQMYANWFCFAMLIVAVVYFQVDQLGILFIAFVCTFLRLRFDRPTARNFCQPNRCSTAFVFVFVVLLFELLAAETPADDSQAQTMEKA